MAVASAPTTPENLNSRHVMQRSFTAPVQSRRFIKTLPTSSETEADGAATLFLHNACKIVSFNTSTTPRLPERRLGISHGATDVQTEAAGTLPWASSTERTIAAGKVDLSRSRWIKTLLRQLIRAQARYEYIECFQWLFLIQIANNAYYRIELPYKTTEEIQEVEKFKEVLTEILQYEQTPCPFARGFHVDLPDPPSTPVRKRPWRPRQRPGELDKAPEGDLIKAEGGEESNETKVKSTPLTSIPLPDVRFESEGHKTAAQPDDVVVAKSKLEHSDEENDSEATDDTGSTLKDITVANQAVHGMIETPTRPRPAKTEIAVADPPQLSLKTVSPPKTTKPIPMPLEVNVESSSLSSSTDSFHSFHSPISPLLPSPPFEDSSIAATDTDYEDVNVPRTRVHQRANSKSTLDPPIPWDIPCADTNTGSYSPDLPETPPLLSDDASQCEEPWSEVKTPSPTTELRQRRKVVSRHGRPATQSPLLSPSNLRSPTGPLSGHHFTTALLQKTCTLLLGPPVQLVALMLNIASKIARGAFRGSTFGYGESGVKIPCSWDFSDADDEGSEEVWDEDDYGVSLGIIERKERVKREAKGWEID